MTSRFNHITVCVCTYKRPALLTRLLLELDQQEAGGLFTYSAVIADNDVARSAEAVVAALSSQVHYEMKYCAEPQQNIAMARNKALEHADGEFIAFIDDDEFPTKDWLINLLSALRSSGASGILGPVKPHFEFDVPRWVTKGRFFERPNPPSGYRVPGREARTGNVLLKRSIFDQIEEPFRKEFNNGGEDTDFFHRMIRAGHIFLWCHTAVVYEIVPWERCRKRFLLSRALLRGANFPKQPIGKLKNILKSIVAVPTYLMALPVTLVLGQHMFVKYLVKLCDHVGRLLACAGWRVVKNRAA